MSLSGTIRTIATVALLGVGWFSGVGVAAAPVAPPAQPIARDHTVSPRGVALAVSDELERLSGSQPKFETFSEWSSSVNIGPPVNTVYEESAPAISADGRSLYFNRNSNGLDPAAPGKVDEDIYVSRRTNRHKAWGDGVPVEALNTRTFHERNATVSHDGSLLFFSSNREPGGVGRLDLYVSRRMDRRGDSSEEWSSPMNLGELVNTPADDVGPAYFEDDEGNAFLYFTSNRLGGPGGFDIYVSAIGADGSFGMPLLVQELSSMSNDARPAIRADGLEVVFQSNRLPSRGLADLWVSTREAVLAPWGPAVNLGAPVNTEFNDRQAALSDDGESLFFASNRVGFGSDDIWASTREKTKKESPSEALDVQSGDVAAKVCGRASRSALPVSAPARAPRPPSVASPLVVPDWNATAVATKAAPTEGVTR